MKLDAIVTAFLFLCAGCAVLSESDNSPRHKTTTQSQSRASVQTKPTPPGSGNGHVLNKQSDSSRPSVSNGVDTERMSQTARTPEQRGTTVNRHSDPTMQQRQDPEESRPRTRSEVQTPEESLKVVWEHFRRFRFKEAIDGVSSVIAHPTATPIQKCDVYVLGGASAIQVQDLPLARQFFGLALQQCPNVAINRDVMSSETCRVFDETKANMRENR